MTTPCGSLPSRSTLVYALALAVTLLAPAAGGAADPEILVAPRAAQQFALLPADLAFPEGIAANPETGDIYVATFNPGGANALLRYDRQGRLTARNDFPGATPILGLAFNPIDARLYLAAAGDLVGGESRIQRIPADFDAASAPETVAVVPFVGPPAPRTVANPDSSTDEIVYSVLARAPNGLAFAADGTLFVSDSFQGAIFRIDAAHACGGSGPGCAVVALAHDPLLATAGFPPFGANGLALDPQGGALLVANTGDDRVLRLDLGTGALAVVAESVNGADGIAFDAGGSLWVAANQADRVVALDADGRVRAELGAFLGLRPDGAPRGLLFPASVAIVGRDLYVTNLALPLIGDASEPEREVMRWSIARIPLARVQ